MSSISSVRATCIGISAILLWSSLVALIKSVSESFGAMGGAALIYTLAAFLLLWVVGIPNLRTFPRRYLWLGSILFVMYEICLSLAIGYSHNGQQAIEVSMVNYLWPTFTIIAAIIFNKQKASWLIIPGFILSLLGVFWVLGNGEALNIIGLIANIKTNPLSYGLAFMGSMIWASYCVLTARISEGKNGIAFFFCLAAIAFWIQYFLLANNPLNFNGTSTLYLVLAALAIGLGCAAWNVGMLHGNVLILAVASYFTPIFSTVIASIVLSTSLTFGFWQGVMMVSIGSVLCYFSTRHVRK